MTAKSYSPRKKDFQRFQEYMGLMHERAVKLYEALDPSYRKRLEQLQGQGKQDRSQEHYWTAYKLYAVAMFIPVFIQIGMKHFPRLVYVDTHAGPGLAKIGGGEKEYQLGSPLLALEWPKIVAEKVPQFKKIGKGFNRCIFIEKDPHARTILKKLVKLTGAEDKVVVVEGDVNSTLRKIISEELRSDPQQTLWLFFVDPYGEIESQLTFDTFNELARIQNGDIILNVMSSSIVRGLSQCLTTNIDDFRQKVRYLWGPLCENKPELRICKLCEPSFPKESVGFSDVLDAYESLLHSLGYNPVQRVEVRHMKAPLYHILFATRCRDAAWLEKYIDYLKDNAPQDYKTLRKILLTAMGRQTQLDSYLTEPASSTK